VLGACILLRFLAAPNLSFPNPTAPLSVVCNGERLQVSATLVDAEGVDRLIRALEANKPLLPIKSSGDEAAN
jgi:hypothetical protein